MADDGLEPEPVAGNLFSSTEDGFVSGMERAEVMEERQVFGSLEFGVVIGEDIVDRLKDIRCKR